MVFVQRTNDGKIKGVYANRQEGYAEEELPDDDNEVIEFFNPKPAINDYRAAIQSLIEETAQSKQYDNAASLASYVASTVPAWAAQAQTFVAWRDAVWQYVYQQLEQFQLGLREQPSVANFVAEITPIDWNEQ